MYKINLILVLFAASIFSVIVVPVGYAKDVYSMVNIDNRSNYTIDINATFKKTVIGGTITKEWLVDANRFDRQTVPLAKSLTSAVLTFSQPGQESKVFHIEDFTKIITLEDKFTEAFRTENDIISYNAGLLHPGLTNAQYHITIQSDPI